MQYAVFILINMLFTLYERFSLRKDIQERYYRWIVRGCSRWMFAFRHVVAHLDDIPEDDILLLTLCHQNNLDFIVLNEFLTERFPSHRPVFVLSEWSARLFPFVREWMRDMHIVVDKGSRLCPRALREKFIRRGFPAQKLIIIIFPEGRLYTRAGVEKSLMHSASQNIKPFQQVLMPRHRAMDAIQETMTDLVSRFPGTTCRTLGAALYYPECPRRTHAFTTLYDLFFPPYEITVIDWTLFDGHMSDVLTIFRRMDTILQNKKTILPPISGMTAVSMMCLEHLFYGQHIYVMCLFLVYQKVPSILLITILLSMIMLIAPHVQQSLDHMAEYYRVQLVMR